MRLIGRLHLIWVLIVLLLAYVIFAMFVANVGGSEEAIPQPSQHAPAAPSR